MPLIRPEVQRVLRSAGLVESPSSGETGSGETTMSDQFNQAGLSDSNIAEEIKNLALHSNNEGMRMRALETALKVKGALKDQPISLPVFNIIIQNSDIDLQPTRGANPILFPRQSLNKLSSLETAQETETIDLEPELEFDSLKD
jgi:hypothetical protein